MKDFYPRFFLKMATLTCFMVIIARLEADQCRRGNCQVVSEGKHFPCVIGRTENTVSNVIH